MQIISRIYGRRWTTIDGLGSINRDGNFYEVYIDGIYKGMKHSMGAAVKLLNEEMVKIGF